MANDFSSRSDCVADWRFESGALATDSKSIQTALTLVGTPTEDSTNYMEGSCCISLAAATPQYAKITDANLAAGFPLKSGDTNKLITISCWVRPTTVDANKRRIWSKWSNTGNKRSLQLYHNSTQIYFQYSAAGTSGTEVSLAFGPMTANQKYHITLTIDGVSLVYWARIFNVTAGTWYIKSGTITGLFVSSADWRIGADDDLAANTCFDGQIDEMVVFNSRLHNSEAVAIKGGAFPVTGMNVYDYLYDPVGGSGSGDGCVVAFNTMKKPFYPGDIIHGAKCVETVQSGTCTTTLGTNSVATTADLSAALPQYTLVRFDADPTIYMVRSISSSAIGLYRPYRGSSASGKSVYKLTVPVVVNDFAPTTYTGTSANPIVFNGGVDLSTMIQNGLTIIDGTGGSYVVASPLVFWNISNLGLYHVGYGWYANSSDCNLTNFFLFRIGSYGIYGSWTRFIVNGLVAELGGFPSPNGPFYNCIINDLESSSGLSMGNVVDTVINRYKNTGYAATTAVNLNNNNWGLRFVDAILDELSSGCPQISVNGGGSNTFCEDVVFHNPTIGSGTLFTPSGGGGSLFFGEVNLVNVNGSATDQRSFFSAGPGVFTFNLVSPDYSVYHTAAPSVKVTLPGSASPGPFYVRHYIPCDAGVARLISAYLRKNSSYGSLTLPFMRLRWVTGTPPNIVHNQHDVAMPDVNDTFEQVSYTVTPSIKGVIIVEIYFNSSNAGAIAWYDDIPKA